jgi:hypothetical protein
VNQQVAGESGAKQRVEGRGGPAFDFHSKNGSPTLHLAAELPSLPEPSVESQKKLKQQANVRELFLPLNEKGGTCSIPAVVWNGDR